MMNPSGEGRKVERACNLWKGFLQTKESNPQVALIFCKGALVSLYREKAEA